MKNLITILTIMTLLISACAPKMEEAKPDVTVNDTAPIQNITVQPKPAVPPQPAEELIMLNKSINTLYNDKLQKFKWGTYLIELLSVSSDNELCNIRINGQSGYYELGSETDFDKNLRVEVLEAFTTHGFTGDACKVGLYNPN